MAVTETRKARHIVISSAAIMARLLGAGSFLALCLVSVSAAELSSEVCRDRGFSSGLVCSSCDLLAQFDLHRLDPDCRSCCQPEVEEQEMKRYAGAVLEYVRGADPVLKLLDQDGNVAEELSITKWNTDSVEEFLSENLERL